MATTVDEAWGVIHDAARAKGQAVADADTARFFKLLQRRLDKRAKEWGHAWVTEGEAMYLRSNNLRQPGHTIYRYSTPNEDLSDKAQAAYR